MCVVVYIFKKGQKVSLHIGDMSRTFNQVFELINIPKQMCHTCLRTVKNYLAKEKQGINFNTTNKPLLWTPHSNNNCETCQRYDTRKKGRQGKKTSMSKGRPKSIGMWDISNIPISNQCYSFVNEVNLTTLVSINQNLPKCLCYICKQLIRGPLLLKKNCQHVTCRSCFLEYIKGKPVKDTVCPECKQLITPEDVVLSPILEALIDSLR